MVETAEEIRRQLQELLSRERDLIYRAENALASGSYSSLRDLAGELVGLSDRQIELRKELSEAQAREGGRQKREESSPRETRDDFASTWRLLR